MDLHFCHCISCLYVGSFLQCLPDSPLRLSPWNHFGVCRTSFSRSPLLKATDAMFSRHTAFVCGGNPCSEGLLSHVKFLVSVPNLQAGVTPTQNEWIEKPGSFNSKIHVSDQFDFQYSLTQLGALYVQKGFLPTWRRPSTQPAQVNIAAVRFAPISSWTCIFVITFLPLCWLIFVMPSWFVSQTFAMESFWSSRDQFFQDHRCWKQRMIYFRDIRPYGLCVWGKPLFRRVFITCPIFSFSSQFTSRGTRHPWPTVCNEATVLDGISGLITLT